MKNFKMGFVLAAALALAGCFERPVVHEQSYQEFEVVAINPPKHFYVDLKRVVGGKVIRSVWVSKHCSRYDEVYIGQRFTLLETVYHYKESGKFYTDIDASSICPR